MDDPDIIAKRIAKLRVLVSNPETTSYVRETALANLLEKQARMAQPPSTDGYSDGRLKMPDKHWLVGAALLIAWGGYSWLSYQWANQRVLECWEIITNSVQRAICVRHAIEARDAVITWNLGAPLALIGGAAILIWTVRQLRQPNRANLPEDN